MMKRPDPRRGTVAVTTAIALPVLIGMAALAIDTGIWYCERSRLQLAADAAAYGAGRLLSDHTADFTGAATAEAKAVTNNYWLLGTTASTTSLVPTVTPASDYSSVTVTLSTHADRFLSAALSLQVPVMSVSATASVVSATAGCVLALDKSAYGAITVGNDAGIVASNCGVFTNSGSTLGAIEVTGSGSITAPSIGAVGSVHQDNGGHVSTTPSPNSTAEANPYASLSVPNYGSCTQSNVNASSWGVHYNYGASNNVFCGNTQIGGNGAIISFASGVTYYVVNGNLVFNNTSITASGVAFVLTGSSPGAFQWTNYSNTTSAVTAQTGGTLAGILVWQTCNSAGSDPASSIAGGSTFSISGALYFPCGQLAINNNALVSPASGGSLTVVADTINLEGSATLKTSSGGSGTGGSTVVLTQ